MRKMTIRAAAALLICVLCFGMLVGCRETAMENLDERIVETYWYSEGDSSILYFYRDGQVDLYALESELVYRVKLNGKYMIPSEGRLEMRFANSQPLVGDYSILPNGNLRFVSDTGLTSVYVAVSGEGLTASTADLSAGTDVPIQSMDPPEDFSTGTEQYIKLPDFSKAECEKIDRTPTEAEKTIYLADYVFNNGYYTPVTDREAKEGDTVVIAYDAFVNEIWATDESVSQTVAVLGSGIYAEEIEAALVGKKPGADRINVTLTLPEDYGNTKYAGKDIRYSITLYSICEYDMEKLSNAAFTGYDSYEALVQSLAEEIAAVKDSNAKYIRARVGVEYALEHAEVLAWPKNAVEYYYNNAMTQYQAAALQSGMTVAQYAEKYFEMSKEEFLTLLQSDSEMVIKQQLVLYGIVEQNGLADDPSVYDTVALEVAKVQGYTTVEQALQSMGEQGLRDNVYQYLATEYLASVVKEAE